MSASRDEKMIKAALREACKGDGRVFPNPSVGAVVFRGDRILGRGHTQPPGGAHAEVSAIASARRRCGERALRGASIAVTLEPCNFQGRTGPCTEAILEAGIARVVAGCRDPHPKVSGRGFQKLRRRGIEVTTGVLEAACRRQHRGFISVCDRGRPWITLKLATTLDGRIATAEGESRWITGPTSRKFVHRLRDASDAVISILSDGNARCWSRRLSGFRRWGACLRHCSTAHIPNSHLPCPRRGEHILYMRLMQEIHILNL